jgi:transcriptional regulator with XRE-family HTH domain
MATPHDMGAKLKELRGARRLEDVAKEVGTTKANLSKIESKPKTRLDLKVFFALARYYEVDPRELATGESKIIDEIPPSMLALIDDYAAIDLELRGPIRILIGKLADQAKEKSSPRKARDKKAHT